MSLSYKFRMLSGLESSGGHNMVWAEAATAAELATAVAASGSIGTLTGDPDSLYVFDGTTWNLIDKEGLAAGVTYEGISPQTLLMVNKLLAVPMGVLTQTYAGLQILDASVSDIEAQFAQPSAVAPSAEKDMAEGMVQFDTTAHALTVLDVPGVQEVDDLEITHAATGSANVTVTLNGTPYVIAVLDEDTVEEVAAKIAAEAFEGWTATASGDTVTFTAAEVGTAVAPVFSGGTTGVTGTFAQTAEGANSQWVLLGSRWAAWTPVLAWTADVAPDAPSTVARYCINGRVCSFTVYIQSADGNDATGLTIPLPVAPAANESVTAVHAIERVGSGWNMMAGFIDHGSSNLEFLNFQQATDAAALKVIVSGQYEIA
jgi:hypothetical protein